MVEYVHKPHTRPGKRLQFAIEHGPVEIVDLQYPLIAWWIFPVRFL